MLLPHPRVSVAFWMGRMNTGGQDVVFHVVAHRGHTFLPVLLLADEGCVQEITVFVEMINLVLP